MKDCDHSALRKRLDQYSYSPSNNIGKGYSSYVYKGRNDLTGTSPYIQMKPLPSKSSTSNSSKAKSTGIYSPHNYNP